MKNNLKQMEESLGEINKMISKITGDKRKRNITEICNFFGIVFNPEYQDINIIV